MKRLQYASSLCAVAALLVCLGLTGCNSAPETSPPPKADTTVQAPIGPGANKTDDTTKPQAGPGPTK